MLNMNFFSGNRPNRRGLNQRRRFTGPSKIIPSKDGLEMLSILTSRYSSSKVEASHEKHPYVTTTTTTTPPPPSPVLWFPGGDADCGGSDQAPSTVGTFSLIALILSIFNIINLLATNSNNNNNRNNINNNLGNVNQGDNSESNANSDGMTATQVMLVPPGVGKRRRRGAGYQEKSFLEAYRDPELPLVHLSLTTQSEPEISTDFKLPNDAEDLLDELALGAIMILNSWTLMESLDHHPDFNTSFICHQRNFCEMGQNSKVFGHGSDTMTQMVSHVMARWLANSDNEEKDFLTAVRLGSNLEHCGIIFDGCKLDEWNKRLSDHRRLSKCNI